MSELGHEVSEAERMRRVALMLFVAKRSSRRARALWVWRWPRQVKR